MKCDFHIICFVFGRILFIVTAGEEISAAGLKKSQNTLRRVDEPWGSSLQLVQTLTLTLTQVKIKNTM